MEETLRGWERKVSGVSRLEANVLLTAHSLLSLFLVYDVSQCWACYCGEKLERTAILPATAPPWLQLLPCQGKMSCTGMTAFLGE